MVDAIVFSKEPWKEDKELEALTKTALKRGIPVTLPGKGIGANDPCHRGNGKDDGTCRAAQKSGTS
jgi:hypothetical protein